MANKGFHIHEDLGRLGLRLNIPPFLKDKAAFNEEDVITTQKITQHRIYVEGAKCKIRRNRVFHSPVPATMFGSISQIWIVACLLSNFHNPILYGASYPGAFIIEKNMG